MKATADNFQQMLLSFYDATAHGKVLVADSPESPKLSSIGKGKLTILQKVGMPFIQSKSFLGKIARAICGPKLVHQLCNLETLKQNALSSLAHAFETKYCAHDKSFADYVDTQLKTDFLRQSDVTPGRIQSFTAAMMEIHTFTTKERQSVALNLLNGKYDADLKAIPSSQLQYAMDIINEDFNGNTVQSAFDLPALDTYLEGAKYYREQISALKVRLHHKVSKLLKITALSKQQDAAASFDSTQHLEKVMDSLTGITTRLKTIRDEFRAYKDKALTVISEALRDAPPLPADSPQYVFLEKNTSTIQQKYEAEQNRTSIYVDPRYEHIKVEDQDLYMEFYGLAFDPIVEVATIPASNGERTGAPDAQLKMSDFWDDSVLFFDDDTTASQLPLTSYTQIVKTTYKLSRAPADRKAPIKEEKEKLQNLLASPLLAKAEETVSALNLRSKEIRDQLAQQEPQLESALTYQEYIQKIYETTKPEMRIGLSGRLGGSEEEALPKNIKAILNAHAKAESHLGDATKKADEPARKLLSEYLSIKQELTPAMNLIQLKKAIQTAIA